MIRCLQFFGIFICANENFCWPIGFYFLPTKPFIFYANFRFLSHYQCKITIVCLLFFENGRKRDLILLCITLIYNLLCVWARRKTKAIHYFSVPNKTHMSTKHTRKNIVQFSEVNFSQWPNTNKLTNTHKNANECQQWTSFKVVNCILCVACYGSVIVVWFFLCAFLLYVSALFTWLSWTQQAALSDRCCWCLNGFITTKYFWVVFLVFPTIRISDVCLSCHHISLHFVGTVDKFTETQYTKKFIFYEFMTSLWARQYTSLTTKRTVTEFVKGWRKFFHGIGTKKVWITQSCCCFNVIRLFPCFAHI